MSKGYSLHIGLNIADPVHYPGIPVLKAAVNDARFWQSFAETEGYQTHSLHDEAATCEAVKNQLHQLAGMLQAGDILLLTYAGHGGQIPNDKPAGFDNERNDQTWCLYDQQLLDDDIYEYFGAFKEGTRIVVISDSCHSATVTKAVEINLSQLLAKGMANASKARGYASRKLPPDVEEEVIRKWGEEMYEPRQRAYKTKHKGAGVKAAVKLLAACQDDEETLDGIANGIFTEAFIHLFKKADSKNATAEELIEKISKQYYFPKPSFFQYGGIIPSFDAAFPFSITIADAATVTGYRKPDLNGQKPLLTPEPTRDQWDTLQQKKPAVLVVETVGGFNGKWTGGKEIKVLDKKQKGSREVITVELPQIPNEYAWSAAHALQTELDGLQYDAIVEPVLTVTPAQQGQVTREGDVNNPDYIKEWPPSLEQGTVLMGWHLDETHSQLAKAQAWVAEQNPDAYIRIGHFDTGYIEGHVALPQKLNTGLAHSFVNKENPNQAIDKSASGQDGHGLGTLSLLAGNKVKKDHTFNEYEGYVGGIPFADVVPVRLAESVVILNTENFCDAIDYAIGNEFEVISMSMAGKPSRRMARAVNDAYDAGIVLVTAASNCWYQGAGKFLPKCVMFPAAFPRVIAATGAMYNHQPYDVDFIQQGRFNITTKYMQGSWGPASRMGKALAAYTPNTPWASTHHTFLRSGGGTSSATPQVAAAAALWIAHHREEMEQKGYYTEGNKWKKVEAVRHALFSSAAKETVFADYRKYYGNGIVRAYDALQVGVADERELAEADKAESSYFGIVELIGSFFKRRRLFRSDGVKPAPEALAIELMHLLQTDPQFYDLFSTLDLSDPAAVKAEVDKEEFRQKVMQSPYSSNYLKEAMAA